MKSGASSSEIKEGKKVYLQDVVTGDIRTYTMRGAKLIGQGYHGKVYCCIEEEPVVPQGMFGPAPGLVDTVDGRKVILKVSEPRKDSMLAMAKEQLVYRDLVTIGFPVLPIIALGQGFIARPLVDASQFGNNISALDEEQEQDLSNVWHFANEYALATGIPLDLKPDNLWWDDKNKQWLLVDTGPRLDSDDPSPFVYTLDPNSAAEYIETFFVQRKGEGAKFSKKVVFPKIGFSDDTLNITTIEIRSNKSEWSDLPIPIKQVDYATRTKILQDYLTDNVTKIPFLLTALLLQGIEPTSKMLNNATANITISEQLCNLLGVCPRRGRRSQGKARLSRSDGKNKEEEDDSSEGEEVVPMEQDDQTRIEFITTIEAIRQLREDTFAYYSRLKPVFKSALASYTGSGYGNMNGCLRAHRRGKQLILSCDSTTTRDNVKMLDALLGDPEAPKTVDNVVLYRGIDMENTQQSKAIAKALHALKPGDIWEDRGFVSTSVQHPPTTFTGQTCCIFKIYVPRGTTAYYAGTKAGGLGSEEEVILLPGSTMRLREKLLGQDGIFYRGLRHVDTFVFDCEKCNTLDRYGVSAPPKELRWSHVLQDRRLPFQPQDSTVGYDRLGLFHLVDTYNTYIPPVENDVLRLVTWNVHEWRNKQGDQKAAEILEGVAFLDPDVIGFQESVPNDNVENTLERDIGYNAPVKCEADIGSYGARLRNDIYVKSGIAVIDKGSFPIEHSRCMSYMVLEVFHVFVVIGVVHLDAYNGDKRLQNVEIALKEMDDLANHYDTKNVIIMGDFNSYRRADYTFSGRCESERCRELENIKGAREQGMNIFETIMLLESLGYQDTFVKRALDLGITAEAKQRALIPANTTYYGGRIDFIFMGPDFDQDALDLRGTYIYFSDASDHVAVVADLRARNAKPGAATYGKYTEEYIKEAPSWSTVTATGTTYAEALPTPQFEPPSKMKPVPYPTSQTSYTTITGLTYSLLPHSLLGPFLKIYYNEKVREFQLKGFLPSDEGKMIFPIGDGLVFHVQLRNGKWTNVYAGMDGSGTTLLIYEFQQALDDDTPFTKTGSNILFSRKYAYLPAIERVMNPENYQQYINQGLDAILAHSFDIGATAKTQFPVDVDTSSVDLYTLINTSNVDGLKKAIQQGLDISNPVVSPNGSIVIPIFLALAVGFHEKWSDASREMFEFLVSEIKANGTYSYDFWSLVSPKGTSIGTASGYYGDKGVIDFLISKIGDSAMVDIQRGMLWRRVQSMKPRENVQWFREAFQDGVLTPDDTFEKLTFIDWIAEDHYPSEVNYEALWVLEQNGVDVLPQLQNDEIRDQYEGYRGNKLFFLALENGDMQYLTEHIKDMGDPNEIVDNELFMNVVISAGPSNLLEVLQLLLDHGANPNALDENGDSPATYAGYYNNAAAEFLLANGADKYAIELGRFFKNPSRMKKAFWQFINGAPVDGDLKYIMWEKTFKGLLAKEWLKKLEEEEKEFGPAPPPTQNKDIGFGRFFKNIGMAQ